MARYRARRGDTLSKIAAQQQLSLNQLLAMNPMFKADPDRLSIGDVLVVPDTEGSPLRPPEPPPEQPVPHDPLPDDADWFTLPVGQVTFDAEGTENPGSRHHSRVPHVPGRVSGVTIGRGYDMGGRSDEAIQTDLLRAGLPLGAARKLAGCAGFRGRRATAHLESSGLDSLSITPKQQYHLFLDTYAELAGDVLRICTKADVIDKYGDTDWDRLDRKIRDIVVDLRYRGDYTPATRTRVQPLLVANDRSGMRQLMADEAYWRTRINVPKDRFDRRRRYLQ